MKKTGALSLFLILIFFGQFANAVPVDLSNFTADTPYEAGYGGIFITGGTVTFNEDIRYAAMYFYNDLFAVNTNATNLSFDYAFQLGDQNSNNYLEFLVNNISTQMVNADGTGIFVLDMSSYRGTDVSLAWGLIWGGALDYSGTVASISNLDLGTTGGTSPVPEPSTMILLGSGLVGLIGFGRRALKKII